MKFGLSQLADVASDEDHYPVRRRGQKRRLNPNRAGIEWLDALAAADSRPHPFIEPHKMSDTGVYYSDEQADTLEIDATFIVWRAAGHQGGNYPRPMFQPLAASSDTLSPNAGVYRNPCAECMDLSRTSSCQADHSGEQSYRPSGGLLTRQLSQHAIQAQVTRWATDRGTEVIRWVNPA